MRALSHLIARDHDTVVSELRGVVEENIDDVEPYFALGAMFRSRGEHERAIRVHQALALRERDRRKLRQRAMFELGLDFRAAGDAAARDPRDGGGPPRGAGPRDARCACSRPSTRSRPASTRAAGLWQRIGKQTKEDTSRREHHLLVAAAQAALGRDDLDSAKQLLKGAQKHEESAHFCSGRRRACGGQGQLPRRQASGSSQALIAEPALVPHLLPGLVAAEQGLLAGSAPAGAPAAIPAATTTTSTTSRPRPRGELAGGDQRLLEAGADKPAAAQPEGKRLPPRSAEGALVGGPPPAREARRGGRWFRDARRGGSRPRGG